MAKAVRKGIAQHELEKQANNASGCCGCFFILPLSAVAIRELGPDWFIPIIIFAFVAWVVWVLKAADWFYREK
jgi:hypothetical protein